MAQALVRPLIERDILAASECIGVVGREASAQRLRTELPSGFTVVPASDPVLPKPGRLRCSCWRSSLSSSMPWLLA